MKDQSQSLSIRTKRFSGQRRRSPARLDWDAARVVEELKRLGSRRNVEGMARFGIRAKVCYGVAKPALDELAKEIGKNHQLALELWDSGVHDARILAGMVDDAKQVTASQMERWVRDFDNWDICDGTCCHLFVFTKAAWTKAYAWSKRKNEFQKRAGFALAAYLAYRDKAASDGEFREFLKVIEREARDERNFVRKAVNWALRNIGKRNLRLNREAIRLAEKLRKNKLPVTRWIAGDALRELQGEAVQRRVRKREKGQ
ncbi:MAG TPA: DNA alkylation repair protein [Candidatus Acidoferrum sp.]